MNNGQQSCGEALLLEPDAKIQSVISFSKKTSRPEKQHITVSQNESRTAAETACPCMVDTLRHPDRFLHYTPEGEIRKNGRLQPFRQLLHP